MVHNSRLWPLDDVALLYFATMRIYAIFRTERMASLFVLVVAYALQTKLSQQDKFRKLIGTLEQTIDIIRHNSIRCSSCVKLKNIGKSFMMLLLKMDLSSLRFCLVLFDGCDHDLNQPRFPQTNSCSD